MPITRTQYIDAKIQRGRGKEAVFFGQTFDVYRIGAKARTSGVISAGTLYARQVIGEFTRATGNIDVETEKPGKTLLYEATIDIRRFVEGDVFVQRLDSYRYSRSIYTLCSCRPAPRNPIFASTPIIGTITRPSSNPNQIDSGRGPQSVPVKDNEKNLGLTVTFGVAAYEFEYGVNAASIPIGMVMEKLRDYPKSDSGAYAMLYDDTRRQTWSVFVPYLPGASLMPRDIITGANGDRYEITGTMPEITNFVGQFVTVQRLRN